MGAAALIFVVLLLGERIDNRAGLAPAGDVVQIRRGESALTAEHVTAAALTFAPEDLLAMGRIPGQRVVGGRPAQRMDVRGDLPDFLFRELLRTHGRAGDAILDRIKDLRIVAAKSRALAGCDRRSDFAGSPIRSVAARAILGVKALALVNSLRLTLERIH